MKICNTLFFHPVNDYTGSTRVLADVIQKDYGNEEVYVLTHYNKGNGFLTELENVHIVNTWQPTINGHVIRIVSYVFWASFSAILAIIYGFKSRFFYINTTQPFYAAIVGRLIKKKIIYHVHEVFLLTQPSKKILRYVFDHTPAHRIFVSYYTKEQFEDNSKCTWEIKYNKLSREFVRSINVNSIDCRTRNRIIMIASLKKLKGITTFVSVAKEMPEFDFFLILSSPQRDIDVFFPDLLPQNLTIFPAQSNIGPFLNNADLMLNLTIPSLAIETFGMTILEAMAYGIPSIVPNVGGPTELIKDGYNGYCIDVTDVNLIVDKIKMTLEDNNYKRLANNSLLRYKEVFS